MSFLASLSPHVHWGLRASLAATFLYHGFDKFPPDGFAQFSGLPIVVAWGVAIAEVAAGVLLIAGAFSKDILTRLGALIVIVIMIGAIVMVHGKNGWSVMDGGMEFPVLMLVTGLYLAAKGNDA